MALSIPNEEITATLYSNTPLVELLKIEKRTELLTGVATIDNDFGFPYGYYVLVGNPGVGKSWFALWLSRVFYKHNNLQSVYFSLEMPEAVIRQRILQQWSDLTKSEFESGTSTGEAQQMILKDAIVVNEFYASDQSKQTPENFTKWVESYYKLGFKIFHFDHLHELAGANENNSNQRVTDEWAKAFQKLTKKHKDMWLFVYAQPNGAAANKNILRRTDIAGSKAITQKCDYFLSLNRPIELDSEGIPVVNASDRTLFLFLDKTRYTEKVHIWFKLMFHETGNFYSMI